MKDADVAPQKRNMRHVIPLTNVAVTVDVDFRGETEQSAFISGHTLLA